MTVDGKGCGGYEEKDDGKGNDGMMPPATKTATSPPPPEAVRRELAVMADQEREERWRLDMRMQCRHWEEEEGTGGRGARWRTDSVSGGRHGSRSVATAAPTAALTTEELAATVAAVDAIVQRQGQIVHTLLLE